MKTVKKMRNNKREIDEFIFIDLVMELGRFGGWINGEDDEYD